jgi:hypothetical protein
VGAGAETVALDRRDADGPHVVASGKSSACVISTSRDKRILGSQIVLPARCGPTSQWMPSKINITRPVKPTRARARLVS